MTSTTTMEENKVHRSTFPNEESIKYYCRVCTANSKNKKRLGEHNVAIFKKIGLKSIVEKFLHLEVSTMVSICCNSYKTNFHFQFVYCLKGWEGEYG